MRFVYFIFKKLHMKILNPKRTVNVKSSKTVFYLFKYFTILAIRNYTKRTANSRSRAFAAVRMRSPPFASVRHRSQPFATVRSRSPPFAVVRHRSPPFAVSLKLNIRCSFNKIRETKNIK